MIAFRQDELNKLFAKYAGESVNVLSIIDREELTQADLDLVEKAKASKHGGKFQRLFNGDTTGYESQSEADLALCSALAFWCAKDAIQMDRIFRKSKLYRPKWDDRHGKATYGEMTLQKAIAGTENAYGQNKGSVKEVNNSQGFRLVQAGLIEIKPVQWLVSDLIERDSLALVFGDPACGKSFWSLGLALCVATGVSFFGHRVEQGPVIYIAGEGQNGLKRRMVAWSIHHGVSHDSAPLYLSLTPAALLDKEVLAKVQIAVDSIVTDHGPPVLIVIDTVARNFGPGDENATQDMGRFIQAVDALRANTQATVLLVHHTGHADKLRARGAMALKGALDAEYRLDKDDTEVIRLEACKMKEGKYPAPEAYRIVPVEIQVSVGAPQFSAVLKNTSYSPPPQKGKAGQGKHQIKGLEILRGLHDEESRKCVDNGKDSATARVSLDEWKKAMKAEGIPSQRIADVVSSLRILKRFTERGGYVSPL